MKQKSFWLKAVFICSILFNLIIGIDVFRKAYISFLERDKPVYIDRCDDQCNYFRKILKFEMDTIKNGDIVFFGNSLTENNNWSVVFPLSRIKNRGVGGDNTIGLLKRLDEILEPSPSKIFLEIGINDILGWSHGYHIPKDYTDEKILTNYEKILVIIKSKRPDTKLYIQNVLPIREDQLQQKGNYNERIRSFNRSIRVLAEKYGLVYIDLYQCFEENGELRKEYTEDGIHLNSKGYQVWEKKIGEDVKN